MERRLTAILAADVVGYSRLMGEDEVGTLARLKACRRELVDPVIEEFHGRIIKLMGDGALVEFASVVDAVQCAAVIQRRMASYDQGVPETQRIRFRIGVNLGDIIVEGNDIYGDGVNIAARLERLADPGGVCIEHSVYKQVKGKLAYAFKDCGEKRLHNIPEPVRVYQVRHSTSAADTPPELSTKHLSPVPARPSIAVLPFENMSSDSEQEHFADGLTEDIVTALSHDSSLFVIARSSTSTYKGQLAGVKRVAEELGADYVLEGSARRAGDRLRVSAQLIDPIEGHSVWAEQYDRSVVDKLDFQDEITRQ
jgi:adenylate cyclase